MQAYLRPSGGLSKLRKDAEPFQFPGNKICRHRNRLQFKTEIHLIKEQTTIKTGFTEYLTQKQQFEVIAVRVLRRPWRDQTSAFQHNVQRRERVRSIRKLRKMASFCHLR